MAFGGSDRDNNRPLAEINTIPLLDVMLVLLIIFLVTAPLLTHTLRIELPRVESRPTTEPPEAVTLAIDAAGRMHWNGEPVDGDMLRSRIAAAAVRQPQPELQLRADRDTRYQTLAEVMALARTAGLARIGFVTEPPVHPSR